MKTTMTISVEEDIKRDFHIFAKDMGTNATNLLSMFMRDATRRRKVQFSGLNYDMEFENFSDEQLDELVNNKSIMNNTKQMEKMLSNI